MKKKITGGGAQWGGVRTVRTSIRKCSYNYLQSINPELSDETRFFKFRPFYDPVEPFEVDLFPFFLLIFQDFLIIFRSISQIFDEKNSSCTADSLKTTG